MPPVEEPPAGYRGESHLHERLQPCLWSHAGTPHGSWRTYKHTKPICLKTRDGVCLLRQSPQIWLSGSPSKRLRTFVVLWRRWWLRRDTCHSICWGLRWKTCLSSLMPWSLFPVSLEPLLRQEWRDFRRWGCSPLPLGGLLSGNPSPNPLLPLNPSPGDSWRQSKKASVSACAPIQLSSSCTGLVVIHLWVVAVIQTSFFLICDYYYLKY